MFDVSAELALWATGTDISQLSVSKKGRFYKGYTRDLMEIDSSTGEISLARSGLKNFLPEGLFFNEDYLRQEKDDELKMKQKIETIRVAKHRLDVFFKGFDTVFFRLEYRLAQKIAKMECEQLNIILHDVFNIDIEKERNPYVRRLAYLSIVPLAKGDMSQLGFFLQSILNERVHVEIRKRAVLTDKPSALYTFIRFVIMIEGLTTDEYRYRMDLFEPFFSFFQQWFLPFDCECDYCIKDYSQRFRLDQSLTLDYNTQFV